ncbi:GNAT superfamily N-acetyltransferase [Paenibacillus mucilaginosus]|uniref:GNAT family N-acetyltransferase n=1 Tax=Paenibacillus mucilaginosus TaxID=61624 RepID=UPI003D1A1C28
MEALLEIKQISHTDAVLHGLIARLDEDLLSRYPSDQVHVIDFNDPDVAQATFVVAYMDGTPAGCGAVRPLDAECTELKRFYVDPAYRNRGIASRMIGTLEDHARRGGFRLIRLETGWEQPEAIALYIKCGYKHIDRFGEYADCPSSVCMEKELLPAP